MRQTKTVGHAYAQMLASRWMPTNERQLACWISTESKSEGSHESVPLTTEHLLEECFLHWTSHERFYAWPGEQHLFRCLRQIPRDHQQTVIYIGWAAAFAIAFMLLGRAKKVSRYHTRRLYIVQILSYTRSFLVKHCLMYAFAFRV